MNARQQRSKSSLTKFHERTGSHPPSAHPEAFDQSYGSANYNVQQNSRDGKSAHILYSSRSIDTHV